MPLRLHPPSLLKLKLASVTPITGADALRFKDGRELDAARAPGSMPCRYIMAAILFFIHDILLTHPPPIVPPSLRGVLSRLCAGDAVM